MASQIDPKGTKPGLTKGSQPEEKTVNMACRSKRNCDSIQAVIIKVGGPQHAGQRIYRCLKCNHTWGLQTGGHLNI